MFRAPFAALAVASVLVLSAPVAANAADTCQGIAPEYANSVTVSASSPSVTRGGTVTVSFSDGYFAASDPVTLQVSGTDAAGVSLISGSASGTGSLSTAASGSGAVTATATFPQTAQGSYTLSGTSQSGCGGVTVTVSNPASTAAVAADNQLAFTGGTLPTILLVTGAGALVFGAILLVVRARARRHHADSFSAVAGPGGAMERPPAFGVLARVTELVRNRTRRKPHLPETALAGNRTCQKHRKPSEEDFLCLCPAMCRGSGI